MIKAVTIRKVSTFSAFRIAIAMSVAGFVIWMVLVCGLYLLMDIVGMVDTVNGMIAGVGNNLQITLPMVGTLAAFVGLVFVVLNILVTPLIVAIYNSFTGAFGGIKAIVEESV